MNLSTIKVILKFNKITVRETYYLISNSDKSYTKIV